MITYYYQENSDKPLDKINAYQDGCWVYVENPTEEEIIHLAQEYGLEVGLIEDALDENEMPRLERSSSKNYLYTRFAYTSNDLEVSTSPVLFILGGDSLITITGRRICRLEEILANKHGALSTHPSEMFLTIMGQIDSQFEVYLNGISRQIKTVRSKLRVEEVTNQDFITFVEIEDELNEFLSSLTPTNAILRRLVLGKDVQLNDKEKELVEDLLLSNEQSIEGSKSSMKSIVSIREAYSTIMSNNLNRVIRILTVATVILAIPTLISSLYGMNIDLPFEGSPSAFIIVICLSAVLSAITLVVLKIKNLL